jgi:hypothetical protein
MPTGAGKTVTFAWLARVLWERSGGKCRALVIVHRDHLLWQAVNTLERVWPGVRVGVVRGKQNAHDAQVVVTTVQTASRAGRLERLADPGFGLCVVDEAHHTPASSYQALLKGLGFLGGRRDRLLLGVSATPYRTGKLLLADVYQIQAFEISVGQLIDQGYLCKVWTVGTHSQCAVALALFRPLLPSPFLPLRPLLLFVFLLFPLPRMFLPMSMFLPIPLPLTKASLPAVPAGQSHPHCLALRYLGCHAREGKRQQR